MKTPDKTKAKPVDREKQKKSPTALKIRDLKPSKNPVGGSPLNILG